MCGNMCAGSMAAWLLHRVGLLHHVALFGWLMLQQPLCFFLLCGSKPSTLVFVCRADLHQQIQKRRGSLGDDSAATGGAANGTGHGKRRPAGGDGGTRDSVLNANMISTILQALEREHELLYQSLLHPVVMYAMELMPSVGITAQPRLAFSELDKVVPEATTLILTWLLEKIEIFSMRQTSGNEDDEADAEVGTESHCPPPSPARMT